MSETVVKTFATFKKIIYRNEYNGYCVFQVIAANESKLKAQDKRLSAKMSCVGNIPEYRQDTPLYLEGIAEESQYGYQLRVTRIEPRSWDTTGLTNYLCNICTGVGLVTADALAEKFSDNLFEVAMQPNGPEILASKVPSLSYETAVVLCETIGTTLVQKEVYDTIAPYGGSWAAATKIAKKYGVNAARELRNDPYSVGMKQGLDFAVCDKLAKACGLSATNESRIKHALVAACTAAQSGGHVFAYETDILKATRRILKKSAYTDGEVPSAVILKKLAEDDTFVIEFDDDGMEGIYLRWMHRAENEVAKQLLRLQESAADLNFEPDVVDWAEENCGIKYAPQQRAAFSLIQKTGVGIVTGGPGTGKTTTVNGLISAYEKLNPNKIIRLCAPTGRAAQRMTESTGRESVTIHRLLEFRPFGGDTVHKNAADPIEADLIVVDEASMLDIELAAIFLAAVKSGTLVLFIGDINQLPSVGPGDVLHDLIDSGKIPTVQLTTVYRQGSQSPIIVNARRINEGMHSVMTNEDYHTEVFNSTEPILLRTMQLVESMYDPEKPFDVQVLAPTHKGEAGVAVINQVLQQLLNPPKGQQEMKYGNRVYRVGDKVILLNNNYSAGYFNGDIGIVKAITDDGLDVDILGKILHLGKAEMEDLNHAFAMTIHKSQGSEFANIVVTLPSNPSNMLKRNLLYTAITRAKKKVYVLTENNSYNVAVDSCDTGKRNTRLAQRIKNLLN